jgi:hypothetical protein
MRNNSAQVRLDHDHSGLRLIASIMLRHLPIPLRNIASARSLSSVCAVSALPQQRANDPKRTLAGYSR